MDLRTTVQVIEFYHPSEGITMKVVKVPGKPITGWFIDEEETSSQSQVIVLKGMIENDTHPGTQLWEWNRMVSNRIQECIDMGDVIYNGPIGEWSFMYPTIVDKIRSAIYGL